MSAGTIEALKVGKWAVGQSRDGTVLVRFDFADSGPSTFAIPASEAEAIAKAILQQPAIAEAARNPN